MFSKRLIILIFSVLFVAVFVIASIFAFTVNKIDTEFSLTTDVDGNTSALNEKLSPYLGSNLIFLDVEKIVSEINEDPYFECTSVEKSFPDSLKVSVRERKEVYVLYCGDKKYITDEEGFVLREYSGEKTRDLIGLRLIGIGVDTPAVGKFLTTDSDSSVKNAFTIAKSVNLTDRINEMKIEKTGAGTLTAYNVDFLTYTDVSIKVYKSDDDGVAKAEKAFSAYDSEHGDYFKSFYSIEAYKEDGGQIRVVWTRYGERE